MIETTARDGFVEHGGLRSHYLEWGDPSDPPLVLLHGGGSSARGTWASTAPGLTPGFHVFALDHRGHGESSWDPQAEYTLSSYVHDVAIVVDHLALGRFSIAGHSMGGYVALVYAATHPERTAHLVLVDWAPNPTDEIPERLARMEPRPIHFPSRTEAEAYVRSRLPEGKRDRPLGYGLIELADGRMTWRADVAGIQNARREDRGLFVGGWDEVAALKAPTLVMRGGTSPVADPKSCARMLVTNPLVRLREYPEAGHWVHRDAPTFTADLIAFLRGH